MNDAAIPAATLIVLREAAGGPPDILMVERTAGMSFAGGAMVFPGGRVDAVDHRLAGSDDWRLAARVAAIRETLEESGIAVGLSPPPTPALAAELQRALHDGGDFAELLESNGLSLNLDSLTPFARWRPAFVQARIFDTLFFVTPAPTGDWAPCPQPGECEAVEWVTAAAVLDRIAAGRASAIFPTVRNLERLARHGSIAAILADAAAHPVETITPWIEEIDGAKVLRIPEGLGYPVTHEPLDSVRRGIGAHAFPEA